MRDLIDREATLACFRDWVDKYGDTHSADEMIEYQRIEALPGVRWIPVTEALPEEFLPVLVAVREKDRKAAWATEESWHYVTAISALDGGTWDYYGDQVAAWRPLPEPYREEDADE